MAFGNADTASYTHDGELVWATRCMFLFGDPKRVWGYGVSPLVTEDAVVLPRDPHKGPCCLSGLDKRSGQIAWKKDRSIGTCHSTPLLVNGQILISGKNRPTACDARTHAKLWQYGESKVPFNGEIAVSPVHANGAVYLQLWRQSPIHAIRERLGGACNSAPPTNSASATPTTSSSTGRTRISTASGCRKYEIPRRQLK